MGVYIPYTRLPSAYQEVEYIENNGTGYINTGLQIKDQYRLESKINCLQSVNNDNGRVTGGYLGYESGPGYVRLYFGGIYSDGWGYGYLGSFGKSGSGYSTNTDYDVEFSWISGNAFIKVNGTTLSSWSTTYNTTLSGECPLMAQNNTGSFDVHPGLRVYYAKYYDSTDTLVRDLVPCYRKADDTIGMYDLVNNTFYTNSGTGTFTKGADVMPELKNAYIGEYAVLPSAYQEVQYIQTTGTQWINTGLFAGTNIQTETKIMVTTTTQNIPIFGSYSAGSESTIPRYYYHLTPYQSAWYYGINGAEGHDGTYNNTVGTIYEIVYNNENNKLVVNDSVITDLTGTTGWTGTTLAISYRGRQGAYYAGQWKYYTFKMYDKTNSKYLRDFVPCYRKSDGEIGMYDLVNNQFYTNSGTGTFTKGPDVN